MCVSVVFIGTITGDLVPVTLQILGAVCFECCETPKLPEAEQKGLLLLLGMGCQNLLRQP